MYDSVAFIRHADKRTIKHYAALQRLNQSTGSISTVLDVDEQLIMSKSNSVQKDAALSIAIYTQIGGCWGRGICDHNEKDE